MLDECSPDRPVSVRAKFKVDQKTQMTSGKDVVTSIKLNPVISGSFENEHFYKYTPGGNIDIQVVSECVACQFEVGKEYYVDFTKC